MLYTVCAWSVLLRCDCFRWLSMHNVLMEWKFPGQQHRHEFYLWVSLFVLNGVDPKGFQMQALYWSLLDNMKNCGQHLKGLFNETQPTCSFEAPHNQRSSSKLDSSLNQPVTEPLTCLFPHPIECEEVWDLVWANQCQEDWVVETQSRGE